MTVCSCFCGGSSEAWHYRTRRFASKTRLTGNQGESDERAQTQAIASLCRLLQQFP